MGQDGRRHHAKADGEDALIGHFVVGFNGGVRLFVGGGEPGSAKFTRAGDPTKTCIKLLAAPRLGRCNHFLFGLAGFFFEHRHVVRALAPDELFVGFFRLQIGVEKGFGLLSKLGNFHDIYRSCTGALTASRATSVW